jgi:hypothetical protein
MGARLWHASVILLGALALALVAPVTQAASDLASCGVTNVTQHTTGSSFTAIVGAARAGDRLLVSGRCLASITLRTDLSIRGIGDVATLIGHDRPTLTVRRGTSIALARLTLTFVRGAPVPVALDNRGTVTAAGLRVRRTSGYRAGIVNAGTMVLKDSLVDHNLSAESSGGGVANSGDLRLVDSVVRGNASEGGGGMFNGSRGTLTLVRSRVSDNGSLGSGGGISNRGTLTVVDSEVTDNETYSEEDSRGGGIDNHGSLRLVDTIVRGNAAVGNGGGIANDGTLVVEGSTVTANTAGGQGGGIWSDPGPDRPGTVTLDAGSSVTGNTPDDCWGTTAC